MARPAKLLSTRGCESRQGRSSGRLVADPSAGERSLVPSGVTQASSVKEGASVRPVTQVNPRRRLDRLIPERAGRPSRACRGEGNRLRSPSGDDAPLGKSSRRTPPGYRGRDAGTAGSGTGETLLGSLRGQKGVYKAEPKSHPAERESDEVIVPKTARTNNLAEGRTSTLTTVACDERLRVMSPYGPIPRTATCSRPSGPCGKSGWSARIRPDRRSSVSRVREIRTHGLKGRGW